MSNKPEISVLVEKLYERLKEQHPTEVNHALKKVEHQVFNNSSVRIQVYVPKALYVVLYHFGAFDMGQSTYFNKLADNDIKTRLLQSQVVQLFDMGPGVHRG